MNKGIIMGTEHLCEMGERLLQLAKNEGATDAIVSISSGIEKSVSVRDGELSDTTHTQSAEYSLTAIVGERRGTVESTSLTPADMMTAAKKAVLSARSATKNPYLRLALPEEWPCAMALLPAQMALLDTCDPNNAPSLRELKERALHLDLTARSEPGVSRTEQSTCGYTLATDVHLASNGFCGVETYTKHSKYTSVIAERDGEMKTEGEGHEAFHFADLRSDALCAHRASVYAALQLGAKPIATEELPVIFSNRVSRMLIGDLIEAIGGDSVYHRSTFLLDYLGKMIFPAGVTIIDEPHLPRRIDSALYDGEGVRTQSRKLIDKGVLTMWMTSIESGAKLGIPSTGHASGESNCTMLPGTVSYKDMVQSISRGLVITDLMGDSVNTASGAYSIGAEGFLIENGVIVRPVNKITIAGNLRDMFRELVPANDLSDFHSGPNAPSCFIPRMMVGGS